MTSWYASYRNTRRKVYTVGTFMSLRARLQVKGLRTCQVASEGAQLAQLAAVTKPGFGFGLWKLLWAPEVTTEKIVTFVTIICILTDFKRGCH